MDKQLLAIKAALVAFVGILGEVLGWKGIMLLIWIALMGIDYLSGTLAAKRNQEWSSRAARDGLFHKGGVIFVVLVALAADLLFTTFLPVIPVFGGFNNPGLLLPLVLAWYIVTEIGSILENANKLGAPVPKWFKRAISKAGDAVEKAGEDAIGEDGDKDE